MRAPIILTILLILFTVSISAQLVYDDFDNAGTITTWNGDNCSVDDNFTNPHQTGINTSAKVLKYHDTGGQYANANFNISPNFDLSSNYIFTLKIYVPSSGITGTQTNQVSLKLQDGTIAQPWTTQSEIIKTIGLDTWQEITFDFLNDSYINFDAGSLAPSQRTDFNRVILQVNGENNNDHVLAYVDDFLFDSTSVPSPSVLVWSDEFDTDGAIDPSKWHHQTQLPVGGSWYNSEIQHYTDELDNSSVTGGQLNLVAKKQTYTDQGYTKQYTSARLNSKYAFKYGRVEVRAVLPQGAGTWPAIWMLGKNINEDGGYWDTQGFGTTGWPACGEIDIMEHWGTNQNQVQSAQHTPSGFGGGVSYGFQILPTASTDFHIYAVEWTADKLVFSVDSVDYYTYNPSVKNASTWPFDEEQYILLNVAMLPTVTPSFIQDTMEIDYVRVYQSSAPVPTNSMTAAPDPIHNEVSDDVISIFSDSYSNVSGSDYNPNWGQATTTTIETIDGNQTLKYTGLNYQGTQFTTQDLTNQTHLHLDFWTDNATTLDFYIISQTPTVDSDFKSLTIPSSGQWVRVNIPLSDFPNIDKTDVFQFKVVGNGTVYFDNLYFHNGTVLPVEMSYFDARAIKESNFLKWETLSEDNNSHFEIERSFDGNNFEKVALVKGNGTTVETSLYEYHDYSFEAFSYYRLKQVDYDNSFTYSEIKAINRAEEFSKSLSIYPNPTKNQLSVSFDVLYEAAIALEVYTITGELIYSTHFDAEEGNNIFELNTSSYPKGTYLLQIKSNKDIQIEQFIKW